MVRVNRFIALAAVLALSLFAAQTTFAGAGGVAGDSFTVVGPIGVLELEPNLWTTDPLGAGGLADEYTYQLFGPESADYRFCAKWQAGGVEVPVAVRRTTKGDGNTWMWFSKFEGSATTYLLFGNADTDTPTVMDANEDGLDDIVVVRNVSLGTGGDALQWRVRDGLGQEAGKLPPATFLFGPADSDPVPGNWDGDSVNGDEPAVTRAGPGEDGGAPSLNKLWQWDNGQGGVGSQMKGLPGDTNVAYTSNGQTRPGVGQVSGGTNAVRVETAVGPEVVIIGPDTTVPIGNCNL